MRTIYRVSGRLHLKCLFKQTKQQSYESYEWKDNERVKRESNKIKQQQKERQKKCNWAELFWCHLLSCNYVYNEMYSCEKISVLFCIDCCVKYLFRWWFNRFFCHGTEFLGNWICIFWMMHSDFYFWTHKLDAFAWIKRSSVEQWHAPTREGDGQRERERDR